MRVDELYAEMDVNLKRLTSEATESSNVARASSYNRELDDLPFIVRDGTIFYIPENSKNTGLTEITTMDIRNIVSLYSCLYGANAYRASVKRILLFNNPSYKLGVVKFYRM